MSLHAPSWGLGPNLLVLLHPYPSYSMFFDPMLHSLRLDGWTILTPDLPGYGESTTDKREYWLMTDYAKEVEQFVSELSYEKLVIGGVSMGGYVTLAFAELFPKMADALILMNTKAAADADGGAGRVQLVKDLHTGLDMHNYLKELQSKMLAPTTVETRVADVLTSYMLDQVNMESISQSLLGMAKRPDRTNVLHASDKPIMVSTGKEDVITGPEVAEAMFPVVKNLHKVYVPHAGHYAALEQPALMAKEIEQFIKEVM